MTIETPLNNPSARRIAAVLRHTVCNASYKADFDLSSWSRIKSMLWSSSYGISESLRGQFISCFAKLLADIAAHAHLAVEPDDLTWLLEKVDANDGMSLSFLLAMATMEPKGDYLSLQEVADLLGHKSTSTLRTWIDERRFLSAKKVGRNWQIARSELENRIDTRILTKED